MHGEQQPDNNHNNKTIVVLYRSEQVLLNIYFGSPAMVAERWADADAFYTIDGETANFIRLDHECFTNETSEYHTWKYAESVLPAEVGDPNKDQVEDAAEFVSQLDDLSYFATMNAAVGESTWGSHAISRGAVFAEAKVPLRERETK